MKLDEAWFHTLCYVLSRYGWKHYYCHNLRFAL